MKSTMYLVDEHNIFDIATGIYYEYVEAKDGPSLHILTVNDTTETGAGCKKYEGEPARRFWLRLKEIAIVC